MKSGSSTPRHHGTDLNATSKSFLEGSQYLSTSRRRGTNIQEPQDVDTQVGIIRSDPPLPNLCEVVVDEMLYGGRHPDRPILSRIVYVAEIASHNEPIRDILESINTIVSKRVNGLDPTGGMIRDVNEETQTQGALSPPTVSTVNISGICVEFASHIICVAESEPAHLQQLMMELSKVVVPSAENADIGGKTMAADAPHVHFPTSEIPHITNRHHCLQNVRVIYNVDDIISKTSTLWTHIDASVIGSSNIPTPQIGKEGSKTSEKNKTSQQKQSDEATHPTDRLTADCARLDEKIVKAVHKLLLISSHAQTLGKPQRGEFSTTAVKTHAQHFPSLSLIETCLKCDLCLSLDEYLVVFVKSPEIVRSSEVVYPCKPHFDYTTIMASIK